MTEALGQAKAEAERKAVLENFQNKLRVLTDEELDKLAGGARPLCDPGYHISMNGCAPDE